MELSNRLRPDKPSVTAKSPGSVNSLLCLTEFMPGISLFLLGSPLVVVGKGLKLTRNR